MTAEILLALIFAAALIATLRVTLARRSRPAAHTPEPAEPAWAPPQAVLPDPSDRPMAAAEPDPIAGPDLPESEAEMAAAGPPPQAVPQVDRREAALTAERAQDWAAALAIWTALKADSPEPRVFVGQAICLIRLGQLEAADSCLAEARLCFPRNLDIAERYAKLATRRGDRQGAVQRWQDICAATSESAAAHCGLAAALAQAGRPQEAETALARAAACPSAPAGILAEFARTAAGRRDWDAAARRWQAMRAAFPDDPAGYAGEAACRRSSGEAAPALAIAEEAAGRFPQDFDSRAELARCLAAAGRSEEALQAWSDLRGAFSGRPVAYAEPAGLLRRMGRHEPSRLLLEEGLTALPESALLLAERAHLAGAIPDWPDALLRWQAFLAKKPADRMGRAGLAGAAMQLGRLDEAGEILENLLTETPDHVQTLILRARLDMARQDWAAAITRLLQADAVSPGDKGVAAALFDARMRAAMDEQPAATAADMPDGDALENRALMSRFESLGDNCEFGLVQRHFGAEPLGLLRWSSVAPRDLVRALDARLDGIGDPDRLNLRDDGREFVTEHTAYNITMHTFIRTDSTGAEALKPLLCRRMIFLARKLLEDIAAAEKIFVYRRALDISDSEVLKIAGALRRRGAARLLAVRHASALFPVGDVQRLSEDVCVGHVSRFGHYGDQDWNIAFSDWLAVCRGAVDIFGDGASA